MKTILKKSIKVAEERIELLRFAFDNESRKMQIEARNEKYNNDGELIDSEPIRLTFRNEKYAKAKDFLGMNSFDKILNMLLRKLEIDRKLEDNVLCDPLPQGIPPYCHRVSRHIRKK